MQAQAQKVLDELHAQPEVLAKAGIKLEPLTRYAITVLMRHGDGTRVVRQFPDEGQARLVCVEPCTWAVEVGPQAGDAVRYEREGELVGMSGWNPQVPLDNPANF